MESKRRLLYVDVNHEYKAGEAVFIREPDWFHKLRPKFKKSYRENIDERASRIHKKRS